MLTEDRSIGRRIMVVAGLAVATAASYLVWGAWNSYRYVDPQATTEGPFEPWQASGLILYLVLGGLAGLAGWRRCAWAAIVTIPVTMAVSVLIIGVIGGGGALLPLGVLLVLISTFLWVSLIAVLTEALSRRKARRKP